MLVILFSFFDTLLYGMEALWPSGRASDSAREVVGSILTQVAVLYH